MKKYLITILTFFMVVSSLIGCSANTNEETQNEAASVDDSEVIETPNLTDAPLTDQKPEHTEKPAPTSVPNQTTAPAVEASVTETDSKLITLSESIVDAKLLDTDISLWETVFLLERDESELLFLHGDGLDWIRNDFYYKEYSYDKKGITIGLYREDYQSEFDIKYIDVDRDKIDFLGITNSSTLEEVMDVLGETDVVELEEGLPGLITYEIRYKIEWYSSSYFLLVYSYDKEAKGGIYISVVDDLEPQLRFTRITSEQIQRYFAMTKEEIINELGSEYISYLDTNLYYKNYKISFDYDESGKQLYKMSLYDYQFNDIRPGYSMDMVMEKMGEREIYTHQTSEDGPIYYIQYKYDNFILQVEHFYAEGWGTYWTIKSTEYSGLW